MGSGHGHGGDTSGVAVARWARIVVIVLLVACGALAVVGVVKWWPDSGKVAQMQGLIPYTAEGVDIVKGRMVAVEPVCTFDSGVGSGIASGLSDGSGYVGGDGTADDGATDGGMTGDSPTPACGDSQVQVLTGSLAGTTADIALTPDIIATGIAVGDSVYLIDTSGSGADPGTSLSYFRADRDGPLWALLAVFIVVVVLVAWLRGLMALVSLAFAGLAVVGYLIPALMSGYPPVTVTLAAAVLILVVMLYLTHGLSMRTSVALLGALVGVGLSTVGASLGVVGTRLAGLGDENAGLLVFNVDWIDVQQLVVASVVLAGLGTLNDVTVTQASALWELRAAAPTMGRWRLFRAAMRIGRDHVASTVYTIVFAYLGTALVLLVAVQLYGGGPHWFLNSDQVAEEIVRVLVGGIALLLAMPVTTAIGALVLGHGEAYQPKHAQGMI